MFDNCLINFDKYVNNKINKQSSYFKIPQELWQLLKSLNTCPLQIINNQLKEKFSYNQKY